MGNICLNCYPLPKQNASFAKLSEEIQDKINKISFKENTDLSVIQTKNDILKSYKIIKTIGRGLFSKVYLATDSHNHKVALKMISKSYFNNKDNIKKIIIEKEVLRILDNEHILKLYRTIQTSSKIVFVLEYAAKGNLLNLLNVKTQLKPDELRLLAAQLIEALLHIHSKGVIYGDLKAENVLINNKGIVKLCDFNFSGTQSILHNTLQGTVNYLAPEIISGLQRTPKSDFWALGILLHLLFYKRFPFKSSYQAELFFNIVNRPIDAEPIDKHAPPALRLLIIDLLSKNFRKRIGNSLSEFKKHKFFEKFDWVEYKNNDEVFNLVRGVPSFENDISHSFNDGSFEDNDNLKALSNNTNAFHYDIPGFTYVNEGPPSGSDLHRDSEVQFRTTNNSFKSLDPLEQHITQEDEKNVTPKE